MRGNWESAEALVLTPNQQLPQQQQTMMEDHPLHSPTTPAWGITDRIVKEEPTEDKNNDSGVSPGHYTSTSGSPRSRRSSSTVNCSLSPGSATSGDSQAIPCSNYDYSPQSLFKNCTSPMEFPRIPGMDEISGQNGITQPMDITNGINNGSDESDIGQDNLQCPVCQFTTQNRLQFTEHLAGHYASRDTSDYQRPLYPGLPAPQLSPMDDSNRASPPSGSERSEQDFEETEEPGVRTPRVNSQGKVKTFRCKQCNFVAVTKLDFWEHSRSHIKVDKLLTCPKCPFVTEYKHHLEYHLRNHFGSKPFKCDKCSYSCVNKSMLNSHLKSHSNVYQYRCANCSYATKYCHSLKLHLRKYNHQPAMVLNADGSPNPLPIIDVYGTRRGPKQKPIGQKSEDKPGSNPQSPQLASHVTPLSPLSMNNGFNPMIAFNPFNTIFTGFPVVNNYGNDDTDRIEGFKTNLFAEYAKAMVADRLNADLPQEVSNYNFNGEINSNADKHSSDLPEPITIINKMENKSPNGKSNMGAPLDLSKPELSINNNNDDKDRDYDYDRIDNSPKINGKNRRKGKAVKLNRQVQLVDTNYNKDSDDDDVNEHEDDKDDCDKSTNICSTNEFSCQYCEIAFGNEVMYTVHMGYHGYKDPFTCNMCGHQCDDKVSFFLHIARSKHA